MQAEPANVLLSGYTNPAPETLSLELDVSWNSTNLNASIQTTTPEPNPDAMSANSLIHQVVVDEDKRTVFTPSQLNASIGDTILFTPVNLGDRIFRIALEQPCQAGDSLSAINFSRLIFPYLVTTGDPTWFSCQLPQRDCAPRGNRREVFGLNPLNRDTANTSNTASAIQMNSMSPLQTPGWSQTGTRPAVVITAVPSLGMWPTSNGTSAMNSSIWATGEPTPRAQPSGTSFSGRAATTEISRGVLSLLIAYHYVIGIL